MKKLLRLSCFLIFAFTVSNFGGTASAQPWQQISQRFVGQIHIVKFLDAFGMGNIGFVGDSSGIWYTTNTGGTWTEATIVSPNQFPTFEGWVNDISFKDATNGFAVMAGKGNEPDAGILITSDGGKTWTYDDNPGTPDSGNGIYFNPRSNRLFVSSLDRGLVYSSNLGMTWTVIDNNTNYTGFAFNNNGFGVLATQGSECPPGTHLYYWIYTTDDGLSWEQSHMTTPSWQPVGIPTTESFFGASSGYCSPTGLAILRSDNGGFGFGPVSGYPGAPDTLNQSMAGDGCTLFAGSADTINGMWYSRNDGNTWIQMSGAPNPPVNTRFYVSPTTVWSFATTGPTLDSGTRPATSDIHIWPDTIAFKSAACMTLSDTIVHVFGCNCQNNPTLTGITVNRLTTNMTDIINAVANPPIPPPEPLCASGVGSSETVQIQFEPTSSSTDSANFQFAFNDNGHTVDTFVHLSANGIPPKLPDPPSTISIRTPACQSIDTCVQFVNTSCDTIILTGCNISEDPECACQLQLEGCCDLANNNQGVELLPGYPYCFAIHYDAGLRISTCTASVSLNWKTINGDTTGTTKNIGINASTTTNVMPASQGFKIKRANCCTVPADTFVYLLNTTCDSIIVQRITISGIDNTAKNFKVDSSGKYTFGIKLHFPDTLPPPPIQGTALPLRIPIDITCEPGTSTGILKFYFGITANFSSNSSCTIGATCGQYAVDSIIDTITLTSGGPVTATTMTPVGVNFGNVNCCDSTEFKTVTMTAGCKGDTINAITLANTANGNFVLDLSAVTPLPLILGGGQQATYRIGFLPLCGSGSGGFNTASVSASMATGKLTSQIGATSTDLATASPGDTLLDFGSVRLCDPQICLPVPLTNASCGSIKISILQSPGNRDFTASRSDTTIPTGGTAVLTCCLNPGASNATGPLSDLVILQVCDPSGKNCTYDTVSLMGIVIPPVPGYTVTALPDITICDSSSTTETFTVTDTSTSCYTFDIVSSSTGNSQVNVSAPGFPVHISPQGSQMFTVTYSPTSVGTASGSIVLTDSDGSTISVPYDFTDTNCAVAGQFKLTTSGDTIITPNCTTGTMTFTATAGGGAGTITSVSITNQPRFSVNPSSGTMPFNGTILFDPNSPGGNTATVTIDYTVNGVTGTTSFVVTGVVVGAKDSARVGVTSLTNACILPNDTALDTFAIVLRDPVSDTLGVTSLAFDIQYDGNLLWDNSSFDLAPGWSVVSITPTATGLHVVLKYSGSGTGMTPANTVLLKIAQKGSISNSTTSTAVTVNVHFNDSTFEACTMKGLSSSGDSAPICIDTSLCGGGLLYNGLSGTLQPVTGIQVIPNPVLKDGSSASLHFTTNVSGVVSADVLDELGHSVLTLNAGAMQTGTHALAIPTDKIPEGAYFTRIKVGGVTVIRKFVLAKE